LKQHKGEYIFANLPVFRESNEAIYDNEMIVEVVENDRKPRKICYLPFFSYVFRDSICDLSDGGKIFKIEP
jgi:hypothetical protein